MERDRRAILRQIPILRETVCSFTVKRMRVAAAVRMYVTKLLDVSLKEPAIRGYYHDKIWICD